MSMYIENKFNIGDFVYITTDPEQHRRVVRGINVYQDGIIYELTCGTITASHYAFELSREKDHTLILR